MELTEALRALLCICKLMCRASKRGLPESSSARLAEALAAWRSSAYITVGSQACACRSSSLTEGDVLLSALGALECRPHTPA